MAAAAGSTSSMKEQQPFETLVAAHRATCDRGVGGYLGGVDTTCLPLPLEVAP